ncbi:hypothetical protein [Bradyrhizobium sp. NP1]|uniref:hypothetical protein n=1 Tax=Bradyrhizobium sp. NP1 TaxID=3049772 RepID=UPI0025A63D9D|nr:hypothetical protein [Bradyrhizobium sp. NP1]WJR75720.1 hypothetical protein QOU61_23390 [Bradyrhizobium sp. NP1]
MSAVAIAVIAFHVLVAVFWAGSTFVLARLAGLGGEKLVFPQFGAGIVAFLSGGYIWHTLHGDRFARAEQVLALGAACALIALLVQASVGVPTVRALHGGKLGIDGARDRIGKAQRVAAALLAVTAVTMVVTRYV